MWVDPSAKEFNKPNIRSRVTPRESPEGHLPDDDVIILTDQSDQLPVDDDSHDKDDNGVVFKIPFNNKKGKLCMYIRCVYIYIHKRER